MSFVVYRAPNPSTKPKPPTNTSVVTPPSVPAMPRPAPALRPAPRPGARAPLAPWPAQTASRPMPAVATPASPKVAFPTAAREISPGNIARLAGFVALGLIVAALYVILPLTVTLRAALPALSNGVVLVILALALVALGEVAVVRVLLRTTPPRQTVVAPRRAPAFSGPFGFDVELSALDADEGLRGFPSLGRGISAGPDLLIVRVGSARWRDYHGPVEVSAYLPHHVIYVRAQILRAEDAPVQGRPQCVLHLRLLDMSPEDARYYRDPSL